MEKITSTFIALNIDYHTAVCCSLADCCVSVDAVVRDNQPATMHMLPSSHSRDLPHAKQDQQCQPSQMEAYSCR